MSVHWDKAKGRAQTESLRAETQSDGMLMFHELCLEARNIRLLQVGDSETARRDDRRVLQASTSRRLTGKRFGI